MPKKKIEKIAPVLDDKLKATINKYVRSGNDGMTTILKNEGIEVGVIREQADHMFDKFADEVTKVADDYILAGVDEQRIQAELTSRYEAGISSKMVAHLQRHYKEWTDKHAGIINNVDKRLRSGTSWSEILNMMQSASSKFSLEEKQRLQRYIEMSLARYDMEMKIDELFLSGVPRPEILDEMTAAFGDLAHGAVKIQIDKWFKEHDEIDNMIGKMLRNGHYQWDILKMSKSQQLSKEKPQLFSNYVAKKCEEHDKIRAKFDELFLSGLPEQEIFKKMEASSHDILSQEHLLALMKEWFQQLVMMNHQIDELLLRGTSSWTVWEAVRPKKRLLTIKETRRFFDYVTKRCEKYNKIKA